MSEYLPIGYAGPALTPALSSFLTILVGHGFNAEASTRYAGKTINILHHGNGCGYINRSVPERGGVLGYRFTAWGRANNACPPEIADRVAEVLCEKYGCQPDDVVVEHGVGANAGRTFLVIKNPTVALQVLLRDTEQPVDEDLHITIAQQVYVEGAQCATL